MFLFCSHIIYLLTGYEVNSQCLGDNKLAIPEYTVYMYFMIPKNILPPAQAISFQLVRTTTQAQSVYPDIALYISNYCDGGGV